jgi:peptide/nickel transport system permease protein
VTIQLAVSIIIALAHRASRPAMHRRRVRKGTIVDYAASALALSGLSIPNFWLGIMLIMVVVVQ